MKLEDLLKEQTALAAEDAVRQLANVERGQAPIREFLHNLGFTEEDGWELVPVVGHGVAGIVLRPAGDKLPNTAVVTKGQYKSFQAQAGAYWSGGPITVSSALGLLRIMQTKPAPEPAVGREDESPSEPADPLGSIAKSLQVIVEQGIVTRLP